MNLLLWSSLLWILYQCWTKVDWIAVQVQYYILWLPEVDREFLLNSARTLTRVFCFLYIIWQVFRYYRVRMQYKMLLGKVTYFMTFYKIPKHIQDRVLQCYQQAWKNNQIKFPTSHQKILPNELYRVLVQHVGNTILDKMQLNQECYQFIISMAPKIKTQYYSSGQFVCRKGTWADKMFFVVDGILEVTSDSGVYLDTMSLGDVVGEIGVLHIDGNYIRTANVRSVGDSELYALKENDVNEIIKDFPEAKKMLTSLGKKRLLRSKAIPEPHFDD